MAPTDQLRVTDPMTALRRGLGTLGVTVHVGGQENLIRRVGPARQLNFPLPEPSVTESWARSVEVHVEGFANLVHEVGHIVLSETLDDDHGIDYGGIPFALDSSRGQEILFEELACCVTSCCYLPDAAAPRIDAWFAEQVGIQPVFYGLEADPAAFWTIVARLASSHEAAIETTIDRAIDRTAGLLRRGGADVTLAAPPRRLRLVSLVSRHSA